MLRRMVAEGAGFLTPPELSREAHAGAQRLIAARFETTQIGAFGDRSFLETTIDRRLELSRFSALRSKPLGESSEGVKRKGMQGNALRDARDKTTRRPKTC